MLVSMVMDFETSPKIRKSFQNLDPGQRAWKLKLPDLDTKPIRGKRESEK
jgi:hypothetical protein